MHCPSSNFMLMSGVCDVRKSIAEGVKIGLGTDISGGHSCSMLETMRMAFYASRVASGTCQPCGAEKGAALTPPRAGEHLEQRAIPLSSREAFHLGTVGSADVLGLSDKIGNFRPGKRLDALVVDSSPDGGGPYDLFGEENTMQLFEKFFFNGDDRNIVRVFVNGQCVHSAAPEGNTGREGDPAPTDKPATTAINGGWPWATTLVALVVGLAGALALSLPRPMQRNSLLTR